MNNAGKLSHTELLKRDTQSSYPSSIQSFGLWVMRAKRTETAGGNSLQEYSFNEAAQLYSRVQKIYRIADSSWGKINLQEVAHYYHIARLVTA